MTPKLCSIHNHATLCDGRDTPEAMAAAAFAQGIRYFGLSCHSHTPIPDDEGAVLPADMTAYRDTVLRLRKTYAGRMPARVSGAEEFAARVKRMTAG